MIELRDVSSDDMAFLMAVYSSTRAYEMTLVDWSEAQKQEFVRMQFEAQHAYYHENYSDAQFQIILFKGQPVGRLYILRKVNAIHIIDITLLPEFRNQGIGSSLFDEILAEAQANHLPVSIHVERFNPAQHLYQRLGFQFVDDQGVYFLMKWNPKGDETLEHVE